MDDPSTSVLRLRPVIPITAPRRLAGEEPPVYSRSGRIPGLGLPSNITWAICRQAADARLSLDGADPENRIGFQLLPLERLIRQSFEGLDIFLPGFVDDFLRQRWRVAVFIPIGGIEILADKLLIK